MSFPQIRHWVLVPALLTALVLVGGVFAENIYFTASEFNIDQWFSRHHVPLLNVLAIAIHDGLGGASAMVFLLLVCLLVLVVKRSVTDAVAVGTLTILGWAPTVVIKVLVGRARPDPTVLPDPLAPEVTGFTSFPSGHTAFAVSLAIAVSLVARGTRWQYPVLVIGTIFALTVGLSRIYLGVHYPSDVAASFVLSIAAALFLTGAWNCIRKRPPVSGKGAARMISRSHEGGAW